MFGFRVDTHLGNIPTANTWNASWERFWTQAVRAMCEKEEPARGLMRTLGFALPSTMHVKRQPDRRRVL
jgi:fructosamine-3-kinase